MERIKFKNTGNFTRDMNDNIDAVRQRLESKGHAHALQPIETARKAWADAMRAKYGGECDRTRSFGIIAHVPIPAQGPDIVDDFRERDGVVFVETLEQKILSGLKDIP